MTDERNTYSKALEEEHEGKRRMEVLRQRGE
jgi:hypothetical protein